MTKSIDYLGSTPAERLLRALLVVIVLALPFGAVVLLSEQAAEIGGRYNSFAVPKLYLVEGLMGAAIAWWATLRRPSLRSLRPYRWPAAAVLIAAASAWWAPFPGLAAVSALHLAVALGWLVVMAAELRERRFAHLVAWSFAAGVTLQAAWGIGQFLVQHDLGLRLLGESALSPTLEGVAKVGGDEPRIRAYGSLPHPNLLAAYLAAAIFFVGTIILWPWRPQNRRWLAVATLSLIILASGLVLTFSRVAILMVVANGALAILFSYRIWRRLPAVAGVAAAGFVITALLVWPDLMGRSQLNSPRETGVANRVVGYDLAAQMLTNRPLGVGAGNFVLAAPELRADLPGYQYQPVHNAPLLIAAELGLLAAGLVLAFIVRLGWLFHRLRPRQRRTATLNFSLFVLAGVFVAMGLADHFFWSLPQGLWLVTLLAAGLITRIPARRWEG